MTKRFEIPGVATLALIEDFEVAGERRVKAEDGTITYEPFVETFQPLPVVPALALINLVSMIRFDENGNRQIHGQAVLEYMAAALDPNDAIRFMELLQDDDRVVPLDSLAEIAMWLSSEQAGRPTEPSST